MIAIYLARIGLFSQKSNINQNFKEFFHLQCPSIKYIKFVKMVITYIHLNRKRLFPNKNFSWKISINLPRGSSNSLSRDGSSLTWNRNLDRSDIISSCQKYIGQNWLISGLKCCLMLPCGEARSSVRLGGTL